MADLDTHSGKLSLGCRHKPKIALIGRHLHRVTARDQTTWASGCLNFALVLYDSV
jgi:hypothetical protein